MAKISILILTITLFCTTESIAQLNTNSLTESEFSNIKYGKFSFSSIEATKGNIQLIEDLMGKPLSIEENGSSIGEKTRKFIYGSKELFVFTGLSPNQNPSISHIETNSITIKDFNISVGDNINSLGSKILKNKNEDGSQSIIFSREGGDCCVVIIDFDSNTNQITRIRYVEWT